MERVTHHKNAAGINIRPEIEQQREGGKDETGKGGVWFCFLGLSTLFLTFSTKAKYEPFMCNRDQQGLKINQHRLKMLFLETSCISLLLLKMKMYVFTYLYISSAANMKILAGPLLVEWL